MEKGKEEEDIVVLSFKWQSKVISLEIASSATLSDAKQLLFCETQVLPARQKLLGLKTKHQQPANDQTRVGDLFLKPNQTPFMMMGTPEAEMKLLEEMLEGEGEESTSNDLEAEVEKGFDLASDLVNLKKIQDRVVKYQVKEFNPLREGKKLLVLDVDYTLFDHRSEVETPLELMRPFLHEFLTMCYEHYDLVIWSATSYSWIQRKMAGLGVMSNPNYKIAFFLDRMAMITVHSQKYGVLDTKGLGVIWGKYKQITEKNTIHIDDLSRNFLMNPKNGLKIEPFRQAPLNRATDRVLKKLGKYLCLIADVEDLRTLDHKAWHSYLRKRKREEKRAKTE
eukprot:TRINITY_DN8995_c0_g1_i1.p1 TRINITY_DN8995_c0_g1~~TRINITY_DN8995_c0_g1_i1.p1  ORF type:complete len:351 (+),score=96.42 TRINITY_DN8995_c0_g1_i1:44-1054(+)